MTVAISAGTPTTGSFDVLPELLCKGRWAPRLRFLYIYVFISEFIARNESSGLNLCIATSILHMCCAASITTSNLAGSGHLLNNIIALCTEFMTYCKVDSIINICIRGVLHQPVHCWFHTAVVGPVNSFACSLAGEALLIALSCQQTTCAWFAKKCRLIFSPRRCCGHRGSNKMSYDKLDHPYISRKTRLWKQGTLDIENSLQQAFVNSPTSYAHRRNVLQSACCANFRGNIGKSSDAPFSCWNFTMCMSCSTVAASGRDTLIASDSVAQRLQSLNRNVGPMSDYFETRVLSVSLAWHWSPPLLLAIHGMQPLRHNSISQLASAGTITRYSLPISCITFLLLRL